MIRELKIQIHAAAASTGAAAGMSDADEKDAYFADAARLYNG